MRYDYKTLYQKNFNFYQAHPIAKRLLLLSNKLLTALFFLAYGGVLVYKYATDFLADDFIKLLAFPLLCLFLVNILRISIERARPYSENGANVTPLHQKTKGENQSFPSRHTACAFVISIVILAYLAWAGICLLAFSLVLAYVRFALGLHYPSDLVGGAIVGILSGILIFFL